MHLRMWIMPWRLTGTWMKNISPENNRWKPLQRRLVLSQARYDNGYTSYLEVIIMQTNLFDAQLLESTTLQQKAECHCLTV